MGHPAELKSPLVVPLFDIVVDEKGNTAQRAHWTPIVRLTEQRTFFVPREESCLRENA